MKFCIQEIYFKSQSTYNMAIALIRQKEEFGFEHQEVTMPSVPPPDRASSNLSSFRFFNLQL